MEQLITFSIIFIALEHLGFLYLEMFLWSKQAGIKIFGHTKEQAETSKLLAANQGLYNGFISAGLIWGLIHPDSVFGAQIILFFLACVITAGIFAGITTKRSIFIYSSPARSHGFYFSYSQHYQALNHFISNMKSRFAIEYLHLLEKLHTYLWFTINFLLKSH